jgi:hypothetical protein
MSAVNSKTVRDFTDAVTSFNENIAAMKESDSIAVANMHFETYLAEASAINKEHLNTLTREQITFAHRLTTILSGLKKIKSKPDELRQEMVWMDQLMTQKSTDRNLAQPVCCAVNNITSTIPMDESLKSFIEQMLQVELNRFFLNDDYDFIIKSITLSSQEVFAKTNQLVFVLKGGFVCGGICREATSPFNLNKPELEKVATIQLHPILLKLFEYHIGAGTNPASSSVSMETLSVECFPCGAWKWGDGFSPSLIEFPNTDVEEYMTQQVDLREKLTSVRDHFFTAMDELEKDIESKYKDLQSACQNGIDQCNKILIDQLMASLQDIVSTYVREISDFQDLLHFTIPNLGYLKFGAFAMTAEAKQVNKIEAYMKDTNEIFEIIRDDIAAASNTSAISFTCDIDGVLFDNFTEDNFTELQALLVASYKSALLQYTARFGIPDRIANNLILDKKCVVDDNGDCNLNPTKRRNLRRGYRLRIRFAGRGRASCNSCGERQVHIGDSNAPKSLPEYLNAQYAERISVHFQSALVGNKDLTVECTEK